MCLSGRVAASRSQPRIRLARLGDLGDLPAVEASADAQFRSLGMAMVADAEPPGPAIHVPAAAAGRLWVAEVTDDAGVTDDGVAEVVGFIRVEIVDGVPHVEQLSVIPRHQRHGIGSALLAAATTWARAAGFARMTLRTFRDVPFNGPFYARRGWRAIADADTGPEMAALRSTEERLGLLVWPRQTMVKAV